MNNQTQFLAKIEAEQERKCGFIDSKIDPRQAVNWKYKLLTSMYCANFTFWPLRGVLVCLFYDVQHLHLPPGLRCMFDHESSHKQKPSPGHRKRCLSLPYKC